MHRIKLFQTDQAGIQTHAPNTKPVRPHGRVAEGRLHKHALPSLKPQAIIPSCGMRNA